MTTPKEPQSEPNPLRPDPLREAAQAVVDAWDQRTEPVTGAIAALRAALAQPAIEAERERAGEHEVPCCYSLHEFEQVCPRTGRRFME